jgi:sugar-specific transcriptional regulator TrmB
MIDLNNLSKQEKSEILSQLLNDPDTLELSEAEFQDRIKRVVQRLYDAVEEYLKEVDKIRAEERKNLWTTTYEGWVSQGRAEVCARIKTILNEIVECPSLTEEGYEVLKIIKKRKNQIVNNEFSNEVLNFFRGRRQAYERLLRFEGKCADALENEWTNAFYLGLECKDRVTEEQLKKIRDKEKEIKEKLCSGSYDMNRVTAEILWHTYNKDRENIEMLTRNIPNADNPHHDEIMDIIKEVFKYGKENENT